jgi:hypothetical protein
MDIRLILLNQLAIMQVLYLGKAEHRVMLEHQIKLTQQRIEEWRV